MASTRLARILIAGGTITVVLALIIVDAAIARDVITTARIVRLLEFVGAIILADAAVTKVTLSDSNKDEGDESDN